MAMMQENGTEKARIAIKLLEKKASQESLSSGLAEGRGLHVLVQTMVLHPEPSLRQGACSILSAVLHEGEHSKEFLFAAQSARLSQGLQRVLHEEDRKTKPNEGEQAIDPDLPLRRIALSALACYVRKSREVLDDPVTASTIISAAGSSDLILRREGLRLALSLAKDQETLPKIVSAVDTNADKAAPALLRAWDGDASGDDKSDHTVRENVVQLMRLLLPSKALRDHLAWNGAIDAIKNAKESELSSGPLGPMLDEIHSWLSLAPSPPDETPEGTAEEDA